MVSSSLGLINRFLEWFGDLGMFSWRVVRAAVTPPFEFRELYRQLDEIGSMSLPLVALAGAATGVVLSLEARYSLTRFGAKPLLPAAIVFSTISTLNNDCRLPALGCYCFGCVQCAKAGCVVSMMSFALTTSAAMPLVISRN
jgi:hypothetical protein